MQGGLEGGHQPDWLHAGAGGRPVEIGGRGRRSSSERASRSSSGRGSHVTRAAHWNSAPARVRRWLMPTTLAPPTVTSPGPRPAKHTSADHALGRGRPVVHRRPQRPATASQGPRPRPPQPGEGPAHVGLGQRVAGGDEHVDPHRLPRAEEHRSPTAAPADDLDPGRRRPAPGRRPRRAGCCRAPAWAGRPRRTTPSAPAGSGHGRCEKRRRPVARSCRTTNRRAADRAQAAALRRTGPPRPGGRAPTGDRSCPRPR